MLQQRKVPLRGDFSDDDDRGVRRKGQKKKKRRCCNNCMETAVTFLVIEQTILVIVFVALIIAMVTPAGKVNQMIDTGYVMISQVNNSGVTDVVFQLATNWQQQNMTENTLSMIQSAFGATDIVFGLISAIEPTIIRDLANRTAITATGFLELVDNIIKDQHLDLTIPLGPGGV